MVEIGHESEAGASTREVGDGEEGEIEKAETEVEEIKKPKIARTPRAPTAKEIAEHVPLHAQDRSWCKWCVWGRGTSNHHKKGDPESKIGVTVSMDHCFATPGNRDGEVPPTLIVYDDDKGAIWAYPCPNKTVSEGLSIWLMQNLKDAGYTGTKITLKSDGDEGMTAIKNECAVRRKAET